MFSNVFILFHLVFSVCLSGESDIIFIFPKLVIIHSKFCFLFYLFRDIPLSNNKCIRGGVLLRQRFTMILL